MVYGGLKYINGRRAEIGSNPVVSKHQIQPEYGDEQAGAGPDCRTRVARPKSQERKWTGKYDLYSSCYMYNHTYTRISTRGKVFWLAVLAVSTLEYVPLHPFIFATTSSPYQRYYGTVRGIGYYQSLGNVRTRETKSEQLEVFCSPISRQTASGVEMSTIYNGRLRT